MSKLSGRTAFITGAGRGQGRAHAQRLAADGAQIIAVDICADMDGFSYPMASKEDLEETKALVEAAGGQASIQVADVRDQAAQAAALRAGLDELGASVADIVVANAGALIMPGADDLEAFRNSLDLLLLGPWNTVQVTKQPMIDAGNGGAIVLTSSSAALAGFWGGNGGGDGYTAAKAGLVGLMHLYANILGPHSIRVNTIHPTGVQSGMTQNEAFAKYVASSRDRVPISGRHNVMPVGSLQPDDIAGAVAWLVSDDAKYVTGVALPVDAGFVNS